MSEIFQAPISEEIWEKKYRFVWANGTVEDETVEDTWLRIARALSLAESDEQITGDDGLISHDNRTYWEEKFYRALEGFKFLPAGRIIAGAGTGRRVTLSNCFTMGTIPDSMDGIFEMLKEAALTMQQGGGIGYDFSTIRPKGALVKGVDADASGPLSFMDCWDSMCSTIMSAGSRRGAMMATMRCDHPDIEDFITAKHDARRLRKFNLSVLVTDAFMKAVKDDADWPLIHETNPGPEGLHGEAQMAPSGEVVFGEDALPYLYRIVRARDLWDQIMRSTFDYAEPGVIFIDRVNEDHNLRYLETIATSNPCGEKPMGPYASCLLGSINLAALVKNPFEKNAGIDRDDLVDLVKTAIRMMDNVVDVGGFPLEAQREKAQQDRQLGLGITGLGDALAMCGLRYGSKKAAARAEEWMRIIDLTAYQASTELAEEKGTFPTFDAEKVLEPGTHASRLTDAIKGRIIAHGLRNALLTSIAPTGTISMYANNVTSGVEPMFAFGYDRRILNPDGSESWQRVENYSVARYREHWLADNNPAIQQHEEFDPDTHLPDHFVTAQTLPPEDHIRMQAAVQKWVDSSISKTVNLPEDISFEDFKAVYLLAYESGCKGCTTYRPNDVTGSVLSVETKEEKAPATIPGTKLELDLPDRPEALEGATYKLKWPQSDHAIYVTISDIEENGQRRPFEIFINSKNMEHYAWTVALTRMISAVFRRAGDSTFVVEELKAVFDPRGGAWSGGSYVPSVLAAIGGVIEKHMKLIGYIHTGGVVPVEEAGPTEEEVPVRVSLPNNLCPKCNGARFVKEGGCETCKDCGHSACG